MSSGVFDGYAAYYDLLNRDKDYAAETAYVHQLVQRHRPGADKILEFGSGTGAHARELCGLGYRVQGVDLSASMVRLAQGHAAAGVFSGRLGFCEGDMRTFRSNERFDVVAALFHVMSYQTSNADLAAAIRTAAYHLLPGGIFVFDCWYGPGVLTDPPEMRVRTLKGNDLEVTRTATPVHYANENRVDVHYDIEVRRGAGIESIKELHAMRYLFAPEVSLLLEGAQLELVTLERWLEGGKPGLDTWNACFVARR